MPKATTNAEGDELNKAACRCLRRYRISLCNQPKSLFQDAHLTCTGHPRFTTHRILRFDCFWALQQTPFTLCCRKVTIYCAVHTIKPGGVMYLDRLVVRNRLHRPVEKYVLSTFCYGTRIRPTQTANQALTDIFPSDWVRFASKCLVASNPDDMEKPIKNHDSFSA